MTRARLACRIGALAVAAWAVPADAQTQASTTTTTSDSTTTGAVTVAPASARQPPRTALIRSALLPGWGQYRNESPLKAVLFGAAAAGFLAAVFVEHDNLGQTDVQLHDARSGLADVVAAGGDDTQLRARITRLEGEYEDLAARRNTRLLYFFTTAALAAVDAYVDAHLADFGSSDRRIAVDVMPLADAVYVNLRLRLPGSLAPK